MNELLAVVLTSREQCETDFKLILKESEAIVEQLGTEIKEPRVAAKQINRTNTQAAVSGVADFFSRVTIQL